MSRNNNAQVTYCNFAPPVPTTKFYTCYKKEICCQQGCCVNGPYQVYQVWYYWLLFLVIFGIISGGSWLCKKPRAVTCRAGSRDVPTTFQNSCCAHSGCNRRRCAVHLSNSEGRECSSCEGNNATDIEDNIILDRLFVSFRNRNALGDPPSYSSIISSDYNNKPPPKFCPLYSYCGPPPTYSSTYKLSSDNFQTQQLITNENVSNHSSAESTANVIQIQVHAAKDENKQIGNTENDVANTVRNHDSEISSDGTNVSTNCGAGNVSRTNNLANENERNQNTPENDNQLPSSSTPENM